MKGTYNVYDSGSLIATFPNIITDEGKKIIGQYLASELPSWAEAIGIGANNTPPSSSDQTLGLEYWREEIDKKFYVEDGNKIILRSILPVNVSGKIYELGAYHIRGGSFGLKNTYVVLYFDNTKETWSNGFFCNAVYRVGKACLRIDVDGTETSSLDFVGDFSLYDPARTLFYLSYEVITGTVSSIKLRLKSNESNYREYSIPTINQTGYTTAIWNRNAFDVIGESTWTDFSKIEVVVEGTNANISFDSLIVKDEVPVVDAVLVSRAIIPDNGFILKDESQELQIEYVLEIDE